MVTTTLPSIQNNLFEKLYNDIINFQEAGVRLRQEIVSFKQGHEHVDPNNQEALSKERDVRLQQQAKWNDTREYLNYQCKKIREKIEQENLKLSEEQRTKLNQLFKRANILIEIDFLLKDDYA